MIPYGIMFHHFCDDVRHVSGQGAISAYQLEEILDAFAGKILSAPEWLDRFLRQDLTDGEVCLTFDDGLLCQFEIALPVLQARGIKAFWFPYTAALAGEPDQLEIYRLFRTVCFPDIETFYIAFNAFWEASRWRDLINDGLNGFCPNEYLREYSFYSDGDRQFRFIRDRVLGREKFTKIMDAMLDDHGFDRQQASARLWMNTQQLTALHDDGHVIGLHSHTHPTRITDLSFDQQQWEFDTNAAWIKDALGFEPICVSYPCGVYDQRLLGFLEERGIRIGFQSKMTQDSGAMVIPRLDHAIALSKFPITQ